MSKMRGKLFHNYMVEKTSWLLAALGWFICLEFCIRRNGVTNFVDIFAVLNGVQIAFEIETTSRHIADNCYKAQAVGIPICIIVPTTKVYNAAVKKTCDIHIDHAGLPIRIFTLHQLEQELTDYLSLFIAANSHTDK